MIDESITCKRNKNENLLWGYKMENTMYEELNDFISFLKSDKCIWGSVLKNGDSRSLLFSEEELNKAIRQYIWEKL